MMTDANAFRSASTALLRAVANPSLDVPSWPDLTSQAASEAETATQIAWLRAVLEMDRFAEGLEYASPALAARAQALCRDDNPPARDVRSAVLSVTRYVLRSRRRATPFGLFAGVSAATFGANARVDWRDDHRLMISASAEWLAAVTARLLSCHELLARVPVVVNNTVMTRAGQLIVPYQPVTEGTGTGAAEVSLRLTAPLRAVLDATSAPIRVEDLAGKILADFPAAGQEAVSGFIAELIARGVLVTGLLPPSTETDALSYLVAQLEAAGAAAVPPVAGLALTLRSIHSELAGCSDRPMDATTSARHDLVARMREVASVPRHPLAIDLRLDGSVVLPGEVAREAERAALALARLSAAPFGTADWKAYHQRFYERFGIGSMVPVLDVVADSGIGFPAGYAGSDASQPRSAVSKRDDALVRLAQSAALDLADEVVLDEQLLASLEANPDPARLPPHLELGFRVHAVSVEALDRGGFWLEVVSVSRGAGVGVGRFLGALDNSSSEAMIAELADLPCADDNTLAAQLSFLPLVPGTAHVARSLQVLPMVISLGEHRAPAKNVLTLADLAVGCDGRRMYLAAPELGCRLEAVGIHALNLHAHTPPLARYLIELSRAQCATVTLFDWGAARTMPFLPRLRYGRTVLAPAQWRIEAAELPARSRPWAEWDEALSRWQIRRRLPRQIYLAEGDRLLALELDEQAHRVLLRVHLDRHKLATMTEARQDFAWCSDRAHEVVIPLKAARPVSWPVLPAPSPRRLIGRSHGQAPAQSTVLLASLYGDIRRQDAVLAEYLPGLLDRLGHQPWWYVRFRDPDPHLRLRIALPSRADFGRLADVVSAWSNELHVAGLLREVRYPTSYPETGRWGSGPAWDAAEAVFRADSRCLLAQLREPVRPHRRALAAAHFLAIAAAYSGSVGAGANWLIDNVPATAPEPVPRRQHTEAVRIADPDGNWAALGSTQGGAAIVHRWAGRDEALAAYRRHLPGPDTVGIDADDVLDSLLHVHFVRAVAIDFREEAICRHLARAAALSWTVRTGRCEQ